MKFIDEYRDAESVEKMVRSIRKTVTKPWTLMEVCGGQTHSLIRFGIDTLLPDSISLIHGPGCPVCVTPIERIDQAIYLAQREDVIFCSFGDMLRVPGTKHDLLWAKAQGGEVRVVYSPMDAVGIAIRNPEKHVVFFAVGFETTAPANAMAVKRANELGLHNFSVLVSHVLVPPAMEAILSSPNNRVQGFLGAGHVCVIMGEREYAPIAERYGIPIVITGFEPLDLLEGIWMCVTQLEQGRHVVENQYCRSVRSNGNAVAQALMEEIFEVAPRVWRGIGSIPSSGLELRKRYRRFDARARFELTDGDGEEPSECIAGKILTGQCRPDQCPAFGTRCTPELPLGAPMVSAEGACSAYYKHRRPEVSVS